MNIQEIIDKVWEKDLEYYLSEEDRALLSEKGQFEEWRDAYFQDICERYQGSCNSLNSPDYDFLEDFDLFQELEEVIFECTCCGWWYESGDDGEAPDGENYCTDCSEEWKAEAEEAEAELAEEENDSD